MKNYYRLMLGKGSSHAEECLSGGFVGAGFGIDEDLSRKLPDEWRAFNKAFIPVVMANSPGKSKIGAGLACGALWTVCKGFHKGDIVLSPDGTGAYLVGEVLGDYYCNPGHPLPHRRRVKWLDVRIDRAAMSEALRNSSGSINTVSQLSGHGPEIERLIAGAPVVVAPVVSVDLEIEDPSAFAMEKHLEAFLVANWSQTILAADFNIYEENGEPVGQQYATDAGPIDVLAISKDKKRLLVVELKRGRANDVVVGQVLRYMGFVKDQLAEDDQAVEGVIIALEDDQKLRWAMMAVPNLSFYRYQVSFKLVKC